jgi:phospholipid/cholesterol/gamma-HCH transport system ATP-binding protein
MIELKNIYKSFGENEVLKGVSARIAEGARTCLVGGSGAGKSVMLKIILGLLEPDEGEVVIGNRSTRNFSKQDWNQLMHDFGVVFQGAALFDSLTVFENVGIRFLEERSLSEAALRERVADALQAVHLSPEIMDRYPAALSGGMRKRVGIARAVIHRPSYLIYDEPTTGLDPVTSGATDDLMEELSQAPGQTSLIVTHDILTVKKIATQVLMLNQGKLVFDGTPEAFFASDQPEVEAFLRRSRGGES